MNFLSTTLPPVFMGADARIQLPRLALTMGTRVLIVHGRFAETSGLLEQVRGAVAGKGILVTKALIEGEPTVERIDFLTGEARRCGVMGVLAVGGGSVLDAGKAIAALAPEPCYAEEFLEGIGTRKHSGISLPWIAMPTTAGTGSEATTNAVLKGMDAQGKPYKRSLRHPNFLPRAILLEPELQIGMPKEITAACAMDALSQLLEAYTSNQASPISDALVMQGLLEMGQAMSILLRGEDSLEMRSRFAIAALCSGFGLTNAGLGFVHGVAGHLGAIRNVPHGNICGALVAPAFSAIENQLLQNGCAGECLRRIQKATTALGAMPGQCLGDLLKQWMHQLQIPTLGELGYTANDIQSVLPLSSNRNSCVILSKSEMEQVLFGAVSK